MCITAVRGGKSISVAPYTTIPLFTCPSHCWNLQYNRKKGKESRCFLLLYQKLIRSLPYREQACEEMVYKYIFSSEVRVCTLEGGKFLMEVSLSSQLYLPQTVCKEKRSERERGSSTGKKMEQRREMGSEKQPQVKISYRTRGLLVVPHIQLSEGHPVTKHTAGGLTLIGDLKFFHLTLNYTLKAAPLKSVDFFCFTFCSHFTQKYLLAHFKIAHNPLLN